MKIAFVSDMPRPKDRVWKYIEVTVDAVAAATGATVEWEIIPAVEDALPKSPTMIEARKGHAQLVEALAAYQPDQIITMGTAPMHALAGDVKPAMKLKSEFGRMRYVSLCADDVCDGPPIPWTPSIAPAFVLPPRNGDLHRDWINVLWKAMTQAAPLTPTDIDMEVVTNVDHLRHALERLEEAKVIGVDVETTGLSSYADSVVTLGLGAVNEDGTYGYAVIVREELLRDPEILDAIWDATWRRTRRTVGHNFKFDMQFIEPYVGWAPEGALIGDTLLLAHLLDERPNRMNDRARGSGLKDLVAQRFDHQYGWDDFEKLPSTEAEWNDFYFYLAQDVVYTARLWYSLEADALEESPRLLDTHDELLMPVAKAIARAELAGAPVDEDWVRGRVAFLDSRILRRRKALETALERLVPTQTIDNILAPGQAADVIYGEWGLKPDMRRKHKDRSTEADILKIVIAQCKNRRYSAWITSFLKLRKDMYLRTVYQKSMLDRIDSDGRLRASFLLHGAATGRISSEKPNLQNVPAVDDREERNGRWWYKLRDASWVTHPMRRAYAPSDPSKVWVEVDYSQLELRVAAAVSGDVAFGDVFREGRDIHREVAAAVFSKPPDEVTKPERYLAKAVSFGILYGRTGKALAEGTEMDIAEDMGLKRWDEKTAEMFIRKFLQSYPELTAWMADLHTRVPVEGFVESPYGRRRRFPLRQKPNGHGERAIQRQAVNTPIQSAASDLCLEAIAEITRRLEDTDIDAVVLFPVHDSVCIEASLADVDRLEALCRDVMEKDWHGVPLTVDFEYGPSWADVSAH